MVRNAATYSPRVNRIACAIVLVATSACAGSSAKELPPTQPLQRTSERRPEPTPSTSLPAVQEASAAATTCAAEPNWRYERIELPPSFAPTLPPGTEVLYFHPEMFDADAEGYWTYVFSLELSRDAGDLKALLTDYYRGLISAVGKSKGKTYDTAAITVDLVHLGDGRAVASVQLFDAFVTGAPLSIEMRLRIDGSCIGASVAPAGRSASHWRGLANARRCVAC